MSDETTTDAERTGGEVVDRLGTLITRWQASGDPTRLEELISNLRPRMEAIARKTLAERHIADRTAVDDVVSLVLDHLRRLPRGGTGEREVVMFRGDDLAAGRGLTFIRLLTRNRAVDVARSRRRRAQRCRVFSMLDDEAQRCVSTRDAAAAHDRETDLHERLLEAVGRLEPPLRTVVELLLEGKSQAVIAHAIDVCEGTVSRMRSRAVARLRELLDD